MKITKFRLLNTSEERWREVKSGRDKQKMKIDSKQLGQNVKVS